MHALLVRGGRPLKGEITVQGAKNSVLPILAAAFLIPGVTCLHRVPDILDVAVTVKILEALGCRAVRRGSDLLVDASHPTSDTVPDFLASELRSSVIFLGAILARHGEVHLSYPGGYALQSAPSGKSLRRERFFPLQPFPARTMTIPAGARIFRSGSDRYFCFYNAAPQGRRSSFQANRLTC